MKKIDTKIYIKSNFLIFVFYFLLGNVFGQPSDIQFEHITIDNGLSQNSINCILQDKDGFIWIGTQEGVNKYCGQNGKFEIYKLDLNDTNSISDIWIYDIAQDKDENIWIATRYGLNRLNPHTREIKRYLNDPKDASSLGDNEVFGVFVDKGGNIWVKTGDALSILNPKTNKFKHFEHYRDYYNNTGTIRIPIFEDKYGVLWTGSVDGLYFFDKQLEQFVRYKFDSADTTSISHNTVTSICEDHFGNLWIGTANGLNRFNRITKRFERFYYTKGVSNSIIDKGIYALMEDFEGNLWIGTDRGLSIMNLQSLKIVNYRTQASNPNGINNDEIISLYKGSSRIIWVGTNGGGLNKADMKTKKFNLYRSSSDENSLQISNNVIASIFLENDSILWIGTYGYGVNIINRKNNSVLKYSVSSKPMSLVDNFVHSIIKDSKNNIWLGTRNGINIYLNNQQKFILLQDYIPNYAKYLNLYQKRIYQLLEDSKKNIWIGTERGLFMINTKTQDVHIYRYTPNDSTCLCDDRATSIIEDSEGLIWIATGAGLNCYNPKTTKFRQFKSSINTRNSLSHNALYSVFEDTDGFIWVGTAGSGINKYDKKNNKFTYYTEKNGLPNGTIYEIEEDNNGNLWFSTGLGLAKLDKKMNAIFSYDTDDGLQSLEFNIGASYKSNKGELFFGGINGFNSFFSDSIKYNNNIPNIVLIEMEIINEYGKQKIFLDGKKQIELTYKDYMFTIYFAALEYTRPEKNNYSYMMENLDESWIDIGTQNQKTFSNLNAGEYVFKLKGSNNDLIWNDKPISIKIIITPPFWKSKWAYAFYIVLIITSILFFIKRREFNLKKEKDRLKQKVMERTAEIVEKNEELIQQKEELNSQKEELENSLKTINLLTSVGQIIISDLNLNSIIDTFYENLNSLIDATAFALFRYNEINNSLDLIGGKEKDVNIPFFFYSLDADDRLAVYCFKKQEVLLINDFKQEYNKYISKISPPKAGEDPDSIIYVPINSKNKKIGVITIQSFSINAYNEYHVNIVQNLANYIAIAIDNSNAYSILEEQKIEIEKALLNLKKTQNQLVESEKMAALGGLVAGVAHEINTPVGIGITASSTLNEKTKLISEAYFSGKMRKSDLDNYLNESGSISELILTNLQRTGELIQSFKQVSVDQVTEQQREFNIRTYLEDVIRSVLPRIKHTNIKLEYICNEDIQMNSFPGPFAQIITNFVVNSAVHAFGDNAVTQSSGLSSSVTQSSGLLTDEQDVRVTESNEPEVRDTVKEEIKIEASLKNEKLLLIYSDNGKGMSAEVLKHIYDPFFTTNKQKGTGLGMHIIYNLVTQKLQGNITAESELGKGVRFTIECPLEVKEVDG